MLGFGMSRSAMLVLPAGILLAACFGGTETGPVGEIPPPPPPPFLSIFLGPADAAISAGGTLQFQATANFVVTGWEWTVSDPSCAGISQAGLLTGRLPGAVRVRACATNAGSFCGVTDLTVVDAPAGAAPVVLVTPGTWTLDVGQSLEYSAAAVNFPVPEWVWSSMDPATATISGAGTVTGRRPGVAVVAACAPTAPRYCGTAVVEV
jgi:hypothetical protein